MKRWMQLMMAGAAAVVVACGSDVAGPVTDGVTLAKGLGGGTDSTGGGSGSGGGQTSNGAVVSVTLSPRVVSLPLTYYTSVIATARDAAGVRVVKPVSWRSSDPAIVTVVGDTGVIYGKALGTAKIYATVDGHSDSATVTVIPTPPRTNPTTLPPVSEFNMTVVAFGVIPGTDTSRTERIANARVALSRVGGVMGDTLSTPVDAGSATTDANGEVKFTRLAGGSYTIRIVPPTGSPYLATTSGIAPPREANITVHMSLRR